MAATCLPPDPQQYYEEHRYVFTGTVQSTRDVGELAVRQEEGLTNTYSFAVVKVDKVLKGRVLGPVKVYANSYWGAPFESGGQYLFYTNMYGAFMIAPECGGVTPVGEAVEDLLILEEIHP
ncbi:MAG: hypothetical protein KC900_08475 [Candidatus Omnitrophica bacterium]|nr:hypothetical protein [Candidatus Omnitrophota bacterium]